MLKKWMPLKEGDIVELIAPGFASSREDVRKAIAFLRSWNLVPRIPPGLFGPHSLCANTDKERLSAFKSAFLNKDSKAVWTLRGGYGSLRLLPELRRMKAPAQTKLFIGLSDITTLHTFINQNWKWSTVHGPMLDRLGKGETPEKYVKELKNFVFGHSDIIEFQNLKPLNAKAQKSKTIQGAMTGGNLITLQASLGTKDQWPTQGKILFFEEIGERAYRVDRALQHMSQIGLFKRAKAVIFGDFTRCHEPDGKTLYTKILKEFAESLDIPVLTGLQSGHDVIQRPLPFGPRATLKTGTQSRLSCPTGARLKP